MRKTIILIASLMLPAVAGAKVKKPIRVEDATSAASPAPFDPNEATRQIRARMSIVRACYERASRVDPGLRGKLQLGFDIAETGAVASTTVEVNGLRVDADPGAPGALMSCIRSQALAWRLSPEVPPGGAHVSYVFVFEGSH